MKFANASKVYRKSGVRSARGTRPVTSALRLARRSQVKGCGIPHLAKNERDVGHPALSLS